MSCGGQNFEGRECPLPDLRDVNIFSGGIEVKALFRPEYKWKLVEEYGPHCYVEQGDGRLLFRSNFVNKDYLIDWLLRFHDGVELTEPEEIRAEMRMLLERMRRAYGGEQRMPDWTPPGGIIIPKKIKKTVLNPVTICIHCSERGTIQ